MNDFTNNCINNITTTFVWDKCDTPKSIHFDDIYFNTDNAIAETQYVFIEGNRLLDRFSQHPDATFTIGETGFGTGLNFLVAWHAFNQFRQQNPSHPLKKLCFISVEKYPLSLTDIQSIHQKLFNDDPNLLALSSKLLTNFNNNTYQDIYIDLVVKHCDVDEFSTWLNKHNRIIDAWFFDGFSPQKNPDMWSQTLFSKLYNVTHSQGSFATFTASGMVRRNLIAAGFAVEKRKGFGKKREMLIGKK